MVVVYPEEPTPLRSNATKVTAATLAEHPLILMYQGTSVRAVTDAAFRKARTGAEPGIGSDLHDDRHRHGEGRHWACQCILPISAREIFAEPSLRSRRISDNNFARPVALIKKAHRTLPPLSRLFAEFLQANRRGLFAGHRP